MTTARVCISLLGLLVFGLGFAVSTVRGRKETLTGSSGDPADPLHKLFHLVAISEFMIATGRLISLVFDGFDDGVLAPLGASSRRSCRAARSSCSQGLLDAARSPRRGERYQAEATIVSEHLLDLR